MMHEANPSSSESATMEALSAILRADLKLGPDVVIDREMPLIGGDHDFDSLDVLLLVTSIEKKFGIKIPNHDVGREAFANVGALARYITELRS